MTPQYRITSRKLHGYSSYSVSFFQFHRVHPSTIAFCIAITKKYAKFVNPIVVSCWCFTLTTRKKTRRTKFIGTKWKNEHGTHVLTVIKILIADFVLPFFLFTPFTPQYTSVYVRVCMCVCALDFTLMNRIEPNKNAYCVNHFIRIAFIEISANLWSKSLLGTWFLLGISFHTIVLHVVKCGCRFSLLLFVLSYAHFLAVFSRCSVFFFRLTLHCIEISRLPNRFDFIREQTNGNYVYVLF